MASDKSIARLHSPEQIKTAKMADLQTDVPAPSAFELFQRSLTAPVRRRARDRVAAPDLMGAMHPPGRYEFLPLVRGGR
jgi:hypothetical protein